MRFKIWNRETNEEKEIDANSFEEACMNLEWYHGVCYIVREERENDMET